MSFGTRRGVYINAADRLDEEGPPLNQAALEVLRNVRPLLPHPLRHDVQLRAAFRSSGRLHFVRAFRRAAALRCRWITTSRNQRAATPTSFPTPPGTRRSAFTRCGRCATKSPASPRPSCSRSRRSFNSGWKICSASAAIHRPTRRSSPGSAPKRSTDIRRPRLHSLGYRPARPAWACRRRSAWPGPQPISTARMRPVFISSKAKAE